MSLVIERILLPIDLFDDKLASRSAYRFPISAEIVPILAAGSSAAYIFFSPG